MKSLRGWRVFFACGVLAAAVSANADPVIPAWIGINEQVIGPVATQATVSWATLDMVPYDFGLSLGFDFTSFPFGTLLLFK